MCIYIWPQFMIHFNLYKKIYVLLYQSAHDSRYHNYNTLQENFISCLVTLFEYQHHNSTQTCTIQLPLNGNQKQRPHMCSRSTPAIYGNRRTAVCQDLRPNSETYVGRLFSLLSLRLNLCFDLQCRFILFIYSLMFFLSIYLFIYSFTNSSIYHFQTDRTCKCECKSN